jgi:hypothetical protein
VMCGVPWAVLCRTLCAVLWAVGCAVPCAVPCAVLWAEAEKEGAEMRVRSCGVLIFRGTCCAVCCAVCCGRRVRG